MSQTLAPVGLQWPVPNAVRIKPSNNSAVEVDYGLSSPRVTPVEASCLSLVRREMRQAEILSQGSSTGC